MSTDYIAGFFDADGYITLCKPAQDKEHQPYVGFTNNVKSILEDIQSYILDNYGLVGHICEKKATKENHLISYDLKYFGFEKCIKLLSHLPIRHPKKVKRLHALNQIKQLTPRNGKYTPENLEKRRNLCEKFLLIK